MVQTHGSVQLSLGVATINGVIDADSKFKLRLTPGVCVNLSSGGEGRFQY